MPTVISEKATIDVYATYIDIRFDNKHFQIPRTADPTIEVVAVNIECANRNRDGVHVNRLERQRMREFEDEHETLHEAARITYHFTQTGVGPIVKVRCLNCGVEKDCTDVDSW